MKTRMLFLAVMSTLMLTACHKPDDEKDQVDETSVTLRFVASEDFQTFYDVKLVYSIDGGEKKSLPVMCNEAPDASFVNANMSILHDYLMGASVVIGPVPMNESGIDCRIDYELTFTRNIAAAIDSEAKYTIVFGQDISTYDGDKVISTNANIVGMKGIKGEAAENFMTSLVSLFNKEKQIGVTSQTEAEE